MGGDARVIAIRDTFTPLIDVGSWATGVLWQIQCLALPCWSTPKVTREAPFWSMPFEDNVKWRPVPGIAAAPYWGDGRVAVILVERLRELVVFRELNLFPQWPMRRR